MDRHQSYTEFLRRHRKLVWALCWPRAHGDYEQCRDLVQEVSLSLWEHLAAVQQRPYRHPPVAVAARQTHSP